MHITKLMICAVFSLWLISCGGSDSGDNENNPETTSTTVGPSSSVVMIASLANQQVFSLNNPWVQADLDRMNVDASYVEPVHITRMFDDDPRYGWGGYKDRYAECVSDFNKPNEPDGNRKCYPRVTLHDYQILNGDVFTYRCAEQNNLIEFNRMRYGYYCGKGHGDSADAPKPRPMDAVDACCRMHDLQKWAAIGPESNEEGIVMCLSMAKSSPTNLLSTPEAALIEESRQCWYDHARWIIAGSQPNNAPPPEPY